MITVKKGLQSLSLQEKADETVSSLLERVAEVLLIDAESVSVSINGETLSPEQSIAEGAVVTLTDRANVKGN